MKVIATKNPVPMEANSRRYITADKPVDVKPSAYYARRIMHGELAEVTVPAPVPAPVAKEGK